MVVAIAAAVYFGRPLAVGSGSDGTSLSQYFAGPSAEFQIADPTGRLAVGDPVFFRDRQTWRQIGYITDRDVDTGDVSIAWHAHHVTYGQCEFRSYFSSGRLEEVITTMLPPEKRLEIQQRIASVMSQHGNELSKAFVPLVQESLKRSLPIIEEEFRRSVESHRSDIDQLALRWNDEVVSKKLIPLARKEILPTVRKHGEDPVTKIGRELWDRASLWSFGWRAVYDKTPLPQKNLVQEEWKRFVTDDAIPVFEKHMDEIVVAIQRIVSDVAANQSVRSELAEVAEEIASDPEARQLVREILRETLIDNDRLRDVWTNVWTSDDAERALDLAGDRLEPVVRQIGDDLFGNEKEGIDPNFARVLRNQILRKDRRWVVATISATPSDTAIELSADSMPYPIVYVADKESIDINSSSNSNSNSPASAQESLPSSQESP